VIAMRGFPLLVGLLAAVQFGLSSEVRTEDSLLSLAQRAELAYESIPRKVLAFYYPWYGNAEVRDGSGRWSHWEHVDEGKREIGSSTHYPTLGPYDSHDPELIAQHTAWANQAEVDGLIVSWWGRRSFSDQAMQRILDGAKAAGLEVTVYYETVPRPQNPDTAAADVLWLLDQYGSHPAWLRVEDRPVVFIYGRALTEIGLDGWLQAITLVNQKHNGGVAFMGDQLSESAAYVFDGIHTYNTAGALRGKPVGEVSTWAQRQFPLWVKTARDRRRIATITVIPGYDDTKIRTPGLSVERFDGDSYRRQWQAAIAANPDWVLITSWNEWHEGSEIEPSAEHGSKYLELTAEFAGRFKAQAPAGPEASPAGTSVLPWSNKLAGVQIGVLPNPDLAVLWSLVGLSPTPKLLAWDDVAELGTSSAQQYPILVYAADEHYRQTVKQSADVDRGLLRYLDAGGLLMVLPSEPMPFYYSETARVAASAGKFGIPLSVSGPDGGWEEPPADVKLEFVQPDNRLPHVPQRFSFPQHGDLRWRPFVRARLADSDVFLPLLELRDDRGKHYGDAVAFVEHRASEPVRGRVIYAWSGLRNTPYHGALLCDLFLLAAQMVHRDS
jgi:hypothetical protein